MHLFFSANSDWSWPGGVFLQFNPVYLQSKIPRLPIQVRSEIFSIILIAHLNQQSGGRGVFSMNQMLPVTCQSVVQLRTVYALLLNGLFHVCTL